jgi:predicted metal-dependent hydrolase
VEDENQNADRETSRALYLSGVALFNRGEFFEAHEVWEELWRDCAAPDRRFYQALIQAAVAAHHWGRGNAAGARRLYHSGRKYMEPFRPVYHGLAVDDFWDRLAAHLAGALGDANAPPVPPPQIVLEQSRPS